MRTLILSFLLHHANREPGIWRDQFYQIKTRILQRYGRPDGHDLQLLPGKTCWTCGGTGVYTGYYWPSGQKWHDTCNRCWRGWYVTPTWVLLSRIRFGKYLFHQPKGRFDWGHLPEEFKPLRESAQKGYKEFNCSPYTREAHLWLYLFYNWPLFKRMWTITSFTGSVYTKGILVGLHRFIEHCKKEIRRRREHLDFPVVPEVPKPRSERIYQVIDDDDLPF